MWRELIVGLDLPPAGEILLAGDGVSDVDLPVGSGKRFDTGRLVLVTRGEAPPEGATVTDTGLEDDSLDLVVFRDAGGSAIRLVRGLREAYRILKPGGGLMLTEFDAETLLDSRPQRYPQLLLSTMYPRVGVYLRHRHPRQMDIGMALVKAGFKDADMYQLDFPLGHFSDYQTYADSVAVEGWRGMDELTPAERQALLDQLPDLMKAVAPAGEFDDVEPVTVARAYKPI
jgi:SAM-dependent methyltransferase